MTERRKDIILLQQAAEDRIKAGAVEEATDGKASNTGKGINSDSFKLGVIFVFWNCKNDERNVRFCKMRDLLNLNLENLSLRKRKFLKSRKDLESLNSNSGFNSV